MRDLVLSCCYIGVIRDMIPQNPPICDGWCHPWVGTPLIWRISHGPQEGHSEDEEDGNNDTNIDVGRSNILAIYFVICKFKC